MSETARTNRNTGPAYHHGDLKSAILERAAEVIERDGIEALTLRGIARDLGVSHGAPNRHFRNKAELLSTLARVGWEEISRATLEAAEAVSPQTPRHRLNAMGQGFLKWALSNKSAFLAVTHPDVERHADEALLAAIEVFQASVREAVIQAQRDGRHAESDLATLTLYTNSVPFGAAMLMLNPLFGMDLSDRDLDELVASVVDLVVPVKV